MLSYLGRQHVGSKHVVEGITKSAAIEFRRHRRSGQHCWPSPDGNADVQPPCANAAKRANFLETHIPTKRMGIPEEIANAIVFIGSDKASYIVVASLAVDGGMTAG